MMTTDELVARVARQTGISPGFVRPVISSALGTIGDALQLGEPVRLNDFGVFRANRGAVSRQITFKAAPQLRGRVTAR